MRRIGEFAAEERIALLELIVNGQRSNQIVRAVERNGTLLLHRDVLSNGGLVIGADESGRDGLVPVRALRGVRTRLDQLNQTLHIDAEAGRISSQPYDLRSSAHAPQITPSSYGAALYYDTSFEWVPNGPAGYDFSAGAEAGVTFFSPGPVFRTNGFGLSNSVRTQLTRLDTSLTYENSETLNRIVAGDSISSGLEWSRSVRFGGVQFTRDYSLQPGLVTQPLPAFFGETALPATVDVYVGNARVFQQEVAPGPFELTNIPVVTGRGEATVVVRDVLGRETYQSLAVYSSARLLAPGLTSFGAEAGFLRDGYGERSWGYSNLFLSGTYRRGITSALTAEAHVEAAPNHALLGAGSVVRLDQFGVASVAIAGNTGDDGPGGSISTSAEARIGPFNIFGSFVTSFGAANDIASLTGSSLPHYRYRLGARARLGGAGALNVSWIGVKPDDDSEISLVSANYALPFGNGRYLSFSGIHDIDTKYWSAGVYLTLPLAEQVFGSASYSHVSDGNLLEAAITSPANPDGGFGYRLSGLTGPFERLEAQADWINTAARVGFAVSLTEDGVASRAGASGAVVLLRGSLFTVNRMSESFLLVDAGRPDVRIYRENREVAVSDEKGEALLAGLSPYNVNRIAVEPLDYPFSTVVTEPERTLTPKRGSGSIIDFSPGAARAVLVRLEMPDGSDPPVGSAVVLDDRAERIVVGRNGAVFVSDLQRPATGYLDLGARRCAFSLIPPVLDQATRIAEIGPVVCQMGSGLMEARNAP